jgi:hypothetical protein
MSDVIRERNGKITMNRYYSTGELNDILTWDNHNRKRIYACNPMSHVWFSKSGDKKLSIDEMRKAPIDSKETEFIFVKFKMDVLNNRINGYIIFTSISELLDAIIGYSKSVLPTGTGAFDEELKIISLFDEITHEFNISDLKGMVDELNRYKNEISIERKGLRLVIDGEFTMIKLGNKFKHNNKSCKLRFQINKDLKIIRSSIGYGMDDVTYVLEMKDDDGDTNYLRIKKGIIEYSSCLFIR